MLALGCPIVIEALWERLGLKKTLKDIAKDAGVQVPYERALLAMVANRLCDLESKLGVWDRWLSKVYLPSRAGLKLRHMYEAMDLLHTHAEDEPDGNATLRKLGHNKEGFWAPQVVVALAVTREGIPVRSWVLPGNTADVSTVQMLRSDLRGWNLGRAMFVADSGMNSEDNRSELARACGKYLLACRMANIADIKRKVLGKRGRYTFFKDNLQAKEVIIGDGERRKR